MKVLMTGCTGNQCKIRRDRNPLYSNALGVLTALESLGHEVDNRKPLENPNDVFNYDIIVVGLYNPAGLAAGTAPQAMLTLYNAIKRGIPVRFFVDDWAIDSIGAGLRSEARRTNKSLSSHISFVTGKSPYYLANMLFIREAYECVGKMEAFKVLCPLFAWISHHSLAEASGWPASAIYTVDPTNLFQVVEVEPQEKKRAWVLSSRHDFSSFIDEIRANGSSWPVVRFGCRKNGDNIVKNELDLLNAAYAPNWGILSHPYRPALQGQWRNRFLFSTWTNSIIYAVGNEVVDLPDCFNLPIDMIERMSDDELKVLALEQKITYNALAGSYSQAMDVVEKWLA